MHKFIYSILLIGLCACSAKTPPVQYSSESPTEIYQQGLKQFEQKQFSQAAESFRLTLDREPQFHDAKFFLGKTLWILNKPHEALYYFHRYEEIYPEKEFNRVWVATLYTEIDEPGSALRILQTIPKSEQKSPEFLYALGTSLLATHQPRPAAVKLNECLIRDANHIMVRYALAKALITIDRQKNQNEAMALLQNQIEILPNHAPSHFQLAQLYEQAGRNADADHEKEVLMNLNRELYLKLN